MIKIFKGDPPPTLETNGSDLHELMEVNYDWYMIEINKGEIKFEFTNDYHSSEVKAALVERQHNKCCFSEAMFVGDFSNVEHFRPKGRIDVVETNEKILPGYYWLAYDWNNLFLCKQVINISYKKTYFPLLEEAKRNRSHHDTNIESPLLIDPSADEPREHIQFSMDEPIHKSERGKATIDLLGLRNEPFSSARRRFITKLNRIKKTTEGAINLLKELGKYYNNPIIQETIQTLKNEIQENIQTLKDAMKPEAEFSSMVIDFLKDWPHLQLNHDLSKSS